MPVAMDDRSKQFRAEDPDLGIQEHLHVFDCTPNLEMTPLDAWVI
jgi:hypothetical protein